MIGLLQRVVRGSVSVDGEILGEIERGLVVLVGVERDDADANAARLLDRLLSYRVFPDETGRMNLALRDLEPAGGLLLVPQFTLAADTRKGTRASFTPAAPPERGRELFEHLCASARAAWPASAFGRFGADMQVNIVNDGPVTFWLTA